MPPTIGRDRALVAGLCCAAAAAVALTANAVWLAVTLLSFEPPPDVEGPSVFVAMLLAGSIAAWTGLEALMAWIAFTVAMLRFPRGRWAAFGMLIVVAALHGLLTVWLAMNNSAPEYAFALGAVVPLTVAAAVLIARAPRVGSR